MKRLTLIFAITIPLACATTLRAESPKAVVPQKHQALFKTYCFDCHDSQSKEGGIDLQSLPFNLSTVESAERWQKVLGALNSGEMPPKDQPQLPNADKTELLDDLSAQLMIARDILSDSAGVITMRRLNRREYENTIYDLLGVRIDAEDLPDDANSAGFDTSGASLFFSSDQFEQYLSLANEALDAAFVFGKQPKQLTMRRQSEELVNSRFANLAKKLQQRFDLAVQWRATERTKTPDEFGFIDESDVRFHELQFKRQHATYRQYLDQPESQTGVLLYKLFNGAIVDAVTIPAKWPAGEYVLRVRTAAREGSKSNERFLEYGIAGDAARAGELEIHGCRQVTGTMAEPQILEIPITVKDERNFGLRQRQPNSRAAARTAFLAAHAKTGVAPPAALWIDWVEVTGPTIKDWPPASTSEIFFKGMWWQQPDQDEYAREIIERFTSRAFRIKEPSDAFLEKLFALYSEAKVSGAKFPEAIREPLAVVMASPGFLYQIEPGVADASGADERELSDMELAVRLSYFLWSSPPDKKLYEVAMRGDLKQPARLAWHVDRMLNDPRSDEFIARFAHQWLGMERLDFFQFDIKLYPEFDESVKHAARQEVYETIRLILDEKRPLSDLLNPDHVVVNDLLADYYGIEAVQGDHFRKVAIPDGSPRGGLLAMAAVLAMGSDGTRSSPVERGAWVMRKLLDAPPPPAPANVPQLSRLSDKLLSPRELQQAHMEEPQCAQCHRKIDPIGFGLENFDAAGKWRESIQLTQLVKKKQKKQKVVAIDPAGQLPDGEQFADFDELREQVAAKKSEFSRGFTEALIEYAMGRPYGFSDESLREQIIARADKNQGAMREYILALVQSKKFRTKK